jgi:hypothetical protein
MPYVIMFFGGLFLFGVFLFGFLSGKISKLWWRLVWIEDHLENLKFYVRKSYEAEYMKGGK